LSYSSRKDFMIQRSGFGKGAGENEGKDTSIEYPPEHPVHHIGSAQCQGAGPRRAPGREDAAPGPVGAGRDTVRQRHHAEPDLHAEPDVVSVGTILPPPRVLRVGRPAPDWVTEHLRSFPGAWVHHLGGREDSLS